MKDTLLALVARCEREGPTFALDREIMYAAFNVPPQHRSAGDKPKPYTTSLDAAVTLVPEGYGWSLDTNGWRAMTSKANGCWVGRHDGSLALALCSAALQARAAVVECSSDPTPEDQQ